MPPLNLLIKPVSGNCNMRCSYCFYTDEMAHREEYMPRRMSTRTMETLIDRALTFADQDCTFTFQGGEPTLAGLSFFKDFSAFAAAHPGSKKVRIHYSFQTNGLLINTEWAEWFSRHHVLVGSALVGPKCIHDRYRTDHNHLGTFDRVMDAIRLLDAYKVDYNILTVVTNASAYKGRKIYNFFQKNHLNFQQYIECLDPLDVSRGTSEYSLTPEHFGIFLKDLFDCWYSDMKSGHYVYNRYFENLMMIILGLGPESCNLRGICSPQWVIESDGSVYPCDFYVLDEWKLGNICTDSFETMEHIRQTSGFIQVSHYLPEECRRCKWLNFCRNGCRRNRQITETGMAGKNYFCDAYRTFLEYACPRLIEIYHLLKQRSMDR